MNKQELTQNIKRKGLELGFCRVGIAAADDFAEYEQELLGREDYTLWAETKRGAFLREGARPRSFCPEAKSIVCAVYSFADVQYPGDLDRYVARAYLSRCYVPLANSICGMRVSGFAAYMESLGCGIYKGKISLPDRMACARAGVVTYGKNNFAYTPADGSFIILYTFLIDTELVYDAPTVECRCPPGCTACMDACPTRAILAPGRLHPQSCMMYNHMLDGIIPPELRKALGTYIHGCDICQKVCPRNKKVLETATRRDWFLEELQRDFSLEKILLMDDAYYRGVVHPIMYNYIRNMDIFRRNAAIALGNTGDPSHLPALKKALQGTGPLVQEAAQWAIARLD